MKLTNTLFGFFLKRFCRRSKIGVFITEKLVGNFAGQKHANIGLLMDCLADEIHAHTGTDSRNIKGAKHINQSIKRGNDFIGCHIDLCMVTADIVSNLLRIFQINGILAHTDGKGFYGCFTFLGSNSTHQRRIQAT